MAVVCSVICVSLFPCCSVPDFPFVVIDFFVLRPFMAQPAAPSLAVPRPIHNQGRGQLSSPVACEDFSFRLGWTLYSWLLHKNHTFVPDASGFKTAPHSGFSAICALHLQCHADV